MDADIYIKGNLYRLVVFIECDCRIVFIRIIGPHEQFDKIDAKTIHRADL